MSKHEPPGLYRFKASNIVSGTRGLSSREVFWIKLNHAGTGRLYTDLNKLIWSDRNPPPLAKRIAPIQLITWNNDKTVVAK